MWPLIGVIPIQVQNIYYIPKILIAVVLDNLLVIPNHFIPIKEFLSGDLFITFICWHNSVCINTSTPEIRSR